MVNPSLVARIAGLAPVLSLLALGAVGSLACSKTPPAKAPIASGAPAVAPGTGGNVPPSPLGAQDGPGLDSTGLHVSDDIARLCKLPAPQSSANFAFDSTSIADDDKDLLSALAKCLSEGALQGQGIALVGRADPRGEDEYNMSLGGARADSVRRYLKGLGVEDKRVNTTSRGELDATGKDEESFARDRRVDINLAKSQ